MSLAGGPIRSSILQSIYPRATEASETRRSALSLLLPLLSGAVLFHLSELIPLHAKLANN